ncbi:MAG: SMI1/KNR4 family protein [Phycisphaerales bacterium]|nr:SMI1/KNR4 family protein [Phycisphaerales bacterium]
MDGLFERVRECARLEGCAYSPIDSAKLHEAEQQLGFSLPESLKSLYSKVANGGFGPGYGIFGLLGGAPLDTGDSVVSLYQQFRMPDPDDPTWCWPERVLPICHWGCAIYSCADCSTAECKMISFDPNGCGPGAWDKAWNFEAASLAKWLIAWLNGDLPLPMHG